MEGLETRLFAMDPRKIKKLDKNARYMTADQHKRLVLNMKRDGCCTSALLLYREDLEGEDYEVMSGNHRRDAAIEAELAEVPCIEILTRLTDERRVAIQLAHNAVTGQDDLSVLRDLYDSLDLDAKRYSGLTDDAFKGLPELDITNLSLAQPSYEELTLLMLPVEATVFKERIDDWLKRKSAKGQTLYTANYADWDKLFDIICRAKEAMKVYNLAIVLATILDLADQRLQQLETVVEPGDTPEVPSEPGDIPEVPSEPGEE